MINRKKPIIWIASILIVVLIILIVCVTLYRQEANRYGKNSSGRQDEKYVAGMVYGYQYISEKDSSYFCIVPESNKCSFSFSLLSSYFPQGTYVENKDTIIMTSDDGLNTYTFKKKGENLVFDASESSSMPDYAYASGADAEICVPDGAIFRPTQPEKMYIDKTDYDIDGDGNTEECVIGYGPTSGVFTFTLSASVNGVEKYRSMYYSEYYELSFLMKNGELKIQGITQDNDPQMHLYDISIENSNIILSEDGVKLYNFEE